MRTLDRVLRGPLVPADMPEMYTGMIVPDVGDLHLAGVFAKSKPKPKRRKVVDRSPAHLSPAARRKARPVAVHAWQTMLANAAAAHYTEGSERWSGIDDRRLSKDNQFPTYSDCSSSYTWGIWNALAVMLHKSDTLNDAGWHYGYTGTLIEHGLTIPLSTPRLWMPADAMFYGNPIEHVAPIVGWDPRIKAHAVIDCGSEGGPYLLPWNYRSDAVAVRRYL